MIDESYASEDGGKKILARLLAAMPAASFEMETFARLAGVVMTSDVPTAAMECKHRPRLLMNPAFIAAYCKRDEHLFLLVMHELWHVLLAHTSLYPRVTQAQNIAFDAIINAGLLRRFNKPAYRGFFEAINPADKFPHCLLRPPVGWPDAPEYPNVGPVGTARILRQLYPPSGIFRPVMPFYDEILDLIKEDMRQKGQIVDMPVLLGDHESNDPYKSAFLKDTMKGIVKKWPMKMGEFGSMGTGEGMDDWQLDPYSSTQTVRRAFAYVLRQVLGSDLGEYRRKERLPLQSTTGNGVLPNARDRLFSARKQLGLPTTLWAQEGTIKARIPERKVRAHVYLDVSGSMSNVLPYLLNLLVPYVRHGLANVFQFSTEVELLAWQNLQKGLVRSTGGTQIHCVTSHLLEHQETVRKALILTDGYTGKPYYQHVNQFKEKQMKIHVVLPHESAYDYDLQAIASSFTVLPPLR